MVTVCRLHDKKHIVVANSGNNFINRNVQILQYPVNHSNVLSLKEYTGQNPVDLCILSNDKYVISCGLDGSLFQWRVVSDL